MRFLLTAEEFGAAEALRIGLVQEVVPAGAHLQRASDPAHLIARQAPLSVQATLACAALPNGARRTSPATDRIPPGACRPGSGAAAALVSITTAPSRRIAVLLRSALQGASRALTR